MEWLDTLLTSEAVWSIVGLILAALLGYIWRFLAKQGVEAEAIDTLRNAVSTVGDEFVVWRKRAAKDGKLTAEERAEAKKLAVDKAKELATGPVLRVFSKWGADKLSALINRVVKGEK
jgi:hypothetical protein